MYDSGKIIAGLVIFLGLVTFPIWYTWGSGGPGQAPEIKTPANEQACVESTEFMAAWHMDLLNQWRDSVVREGNRISNTGRGGILCDRNSLDLGIAGNHITGTGGKVLGIDVLGG